MALALHKLMCALPGSLQFNPPAHEMFKSCTSVTCPHTRPHPFLYVFLSFAITFVPACKFNHSCVHEKAASPRLTPAKVAEKIIIGHCLPSPFIVYSRWKSTKEAQTAFFSFLHWCLLYILVSKFHTGVRKCPTQTLFMGKWTQTGQCAGVSLIPLKSHTVKWPQIKGNNRIFEIGFGDLCELL